MNRVPSRRSCLPDCSDRMQEAIIGLPYGGRVVGSIQVSFRVVLMIRVWFIEIFLIPNRNRAVIGKTSADDQIAIDLNVARRCNDHNSTRINCKVAVKRDRAINRLRPAIAEEDMGVRQRSYGLRPGAVVLYCAIKRERREVRREITACQAAARSSHS